jgi:hypothetical protein
MQLRVYLIIGDKEQLVLEKYGEEFYDSAIPEQIKTCCLNFLQ